MANLPSLNAQRGSTIQQVRNASPNYTSNPEDLVVLSDSNEITRSDTTSSVTSNSRLIDSARADIILEDKFDEEMTGVNYDFNDSVIEYSLTLTGIENEFSTTYKQQVKTITISSRGTYENQVLDIDWASRSSDSISIEPSSGSGSSTGVEVTVAENKSNMEMVESFTISSVESGLSQTISTRIMAHTFGGVFDTAGAYTHPFFHYLDYEKLFVGTFLSLSECVAGTSFLAAQTHVVDFFKGKPTGIINLNVVQGVKWPSVSKGPWTAELLDTDQEIVDAITIHSPSNVGLNGPGFYVSADLSKLNKHNRLATIRFKSGDTSHFKDVVLPLGVSELTTATNTGHTSTDRNKFLNYELGLDLDATPAINQLTELTYNGSAPTSAQKLDFAFTNHALAGRYYRIGDIRTGTSIKIKSVDNNGNPVRWKVFRTAFTSDRCYRLSITEGVGGDVVNIDDSNVKLSEPDSSLGSFIDIIQEYSFKVIRIFLPSTASNVPEVYLATNRSDNFGVITSNLTFGNNTSSTGTTIRDSCLVGVKVTANLVESTNVIKVPINTTGEKRLSFTPKAYSPYRDLTEDSYNAISVKSTSGINFSDYTLSYVESGVTSECSITPTIISTSSSFNS